MSLNPFECLGEASTNTEDKERPKTLENQGNRAYIPETPRKKLKSKRKATSPPPKEQLNDKSTTYYLSLAKIAIELAIKAEKETQKKEYIIDNDIQLLKESLEAILEERDLEIPVIKLENIELQRKFNYIKKKMDQMATQIQKMAGELTPKEIIPIPTPILIHILTRPISFADIVKKGPSIALEAIPNNTGIFLKPVPQKAKPTNYKDRRLILNKATEKEKKSIP
jgi:hypothetical protein